jgi:hypothetical protein
MMSRLLQQVVLLQSLQQLFLALQLLQPQEPPQPQVLWLLLLGLAGYQHSL